MTTSGPISLNATSLNSTSLSNYNDLTRLQSIKHQARSDNGAAKAGALDAVAKQFESIFVSMMIKSMREANKGFSEGNLLQSSETEFYQQMFDSQLAVTLSTSGGLGLADIIKRQISSSVSTVQGSALDRTGDGIRQGGESNKIFDMKGYTRKAFPSLIRSESMQQTVAKIEQTLQSLPDSPVDARSSATKIMDFSSPDKFIESLYPFAEEVEQQTGIDAGVMLAQSALETGWGQHQILNADGTPTFNLFGIKAQSDWQGDSADIVTTEYRQGVAMKERASFRSYDSYGESFQDYAQFLMSQDRYQPALNQLEDPKAFAYALQDSGYATDPQYGSKISRIMDRYLPDTLISDSQRNVSATGEQR